jgi:hypothetical protein
MAQSLVFKGGYPPRVAFPSDLIAPFDAVCKQARIDNRPSE